MIPQSITAKMGWNLHQLPNHPLCIVKDQIYSNFPNFKKFDDIHPIVSTYDNFDSLRIPAEHPSRSKSDTFYFDSNHVLRTHTSAHQVQLLKIGHQQFLVTGDVFRKDDIDQTHYPVFHQVEGVSICSNPEKSLRETITGLMQTLFPGKSFRFKEDYFPFTLPSWEVEVDFNGKWLEVLGCGVIHPEVLKNAGVTGEGWAFGMGLERLAMILFDIDDIRLFWSKDERFLNQFKSGQLNKFVPFSKQPPCYKDISMWIPSDFKEVSFMEIIRDSAGDLVESVKLIDSYIPSEGKKSNCYRITYRAVDRSLTNVEVDIIQAAIRIRITEDLGVTIR